MIYFRVDMNEYIATGHMMRCISIANQVKQYGGDVTFILADDYAVELLEKSEMAYIILGTKWNDLDTELEHMKKVLEENNVSVLFVDSYYVTEMYLKQLSEWSKVVFLDDLNKIKVTADSLICYASYFEKFKYYEKYQNMNFYLGTNYTPLRDEFQDLEKKKINKRISSCLIMSGGSDQYDAISTLVGLFTTIDNMEVYIICGRYYSNYEILTKKYKGNKNIHIMKNIPNIIEYMSLVDLAISAGGTTLYELCAVGTPTISYIVADNQIENAQKFEELEIIPCAGDIRKNDIIPNVKNILEKLDFERRKNISKKMQCMVDGRGAERIAKILIEKEQNHV